MMTNQQQRTFSINAGLSLAIPVVYFLGASAYTSAQPQENLRTQT
jgi:hypothetical protein